MGQGDDVMDTHSREPRSPDQPLLRRTRLRFMAWSAGVTLVALVVVGTAIYAAVSASLAEASTDQLRSRAADLSTAVAGGKRAILDGGDAAFVVTDPAKPGVVFGGESSGTLGIVTAPVPGPGDKPVGDTFVAGVEDPGLTRDGVPKTLGSGALALSPIDPDGMREALAGGTVVHDAIVDETPVRVLSEGFRSGGVDYVVQVIGDRTNEQRTLGIIVVVLGVGSLLVLAAALAVGYVLSGRALVPIRDSLRRQREFAADASHELRTPLTIVRTSVEHLRRHPEAQVSDVSGTIDDIDEGVGRLTGLVDDLLLLARTDSGAIEVERVSVELAEVALEAVEGLAGVARTREARIELDVEPVVIDGDPARLRQLTSLLVENALRHGPGGQEIHVRVRATPSGGSLVVDDEGSGIPAADLAHVFERFYRGADAPPGGSGLGLAIAHWIVDRHGGSIRVENLPTGGARFSVSLPA
jgi:two-component system sensor histidine kinase CiaH